MPNPPPFTLCQLSRSNVKQAVNLYRVAAYNFTRILIRQPQSQFAFSAARRSNDNQERTRSRHLLAGNLAQNTQRVLTRDLAYVLLAVSLLSQRRAQSRHLRNILQTLRRTADAIEIAADAHVVDAHHFYRVIDMRHRIVDRAHRWPRFGSIFKEL